MSISFLAPVLDVCSYSIEAFLGSDDGLPKEGSAFGGSLSLSRTLPRPPPRVHQRLLLTCLRFSHEPRTQRARAQNEDPKLYIHGYIHSY